MYSLYRNVGVWRGVFFVIVDFFLILIIGELLFIGWDWEVVGLEWKLDKNGFVLFVLDCIDFYLDISFSGSGDGLENEWLDFFGCWVFWLYLFLFLLLINDVCFIVFFFINSCGLLGDVVFFEEKYKFFYCYGWL